MILEVREVTKSIASFCVFSAIFLAHPSTHLQHRTVAMTWPQHFILDTPSAPHPYIRHRGGQGSVVLLYASVILLDIPVRFLKQLRILMQLEIEERPAQRLFYFALAFAGVLPTGKAHQAYDFVNLGDDALHDDRRLRVAHRLEEFGQRRLAPVFILCRWRLFFRPFFR